VNYLKTCDTEVIDKLQDWSAVLCARARIPQNIWYYSTINHISLFVSKHYFQQNVLTFRKLQHVAGNYVGFTNKSGPGSSVGIATGYELDSPEIESRWRCDFSYTSRPALGPTQSLVQWVRSLSRG
jgi:hypothetical protein